MEQLTSKKPGFWTKHKTEKIVVGVVILVVVVMGILLLLGYLNVIMPRYHCEGAVCVKNKQGKPDPSGSFKKSKCGLTCTTPITKGAHKCDGAACVACTAGADGCNYMDSSCNNECTPKVGAYIPNWTAYRTGSGQFPQNWSWANNKAVFNLPPGLDTVLYAFVEFDVAGDLNWGLKDGAPIPANVINGKVNTDLDRFDDAAMTAIGNMNNIPNRLVSVGGYNFSIKTPSIWEAISSGNIAAITHLAENLKKMCEFYHFTGIDIDWEYPRNKTSLTVLITELHRVLNPAKLKLTLALPVNPSVLNAGFDLVAIDRYIDWYHLMSYDINGNFGNADGKLVFGANTDMAYIDTALDALTKLVPPSKVSMGLAAYGRCTSFMESPLKSPFGKAFTPIDEKKCNAYSVDSSDYASYTGYHPQCYSGPFTKQVGYLSYYEILDLIDDASATVTFDNGTQSVYTIVTKQNSLGDPPFLVISFDNVASIEAKTRAALARNLHGVFVWQLADDDFLNGYPLTTTAISVAKAAPAYVVPSSRSKYTLGPCGLAWKESATKQADACDPGGKSPCWDLSTCTPIVPASCLVATDDQDKYVSLKEGSGQGFDQFLENTCGNVVYKGAKFAPQFYRDIVKQDRVSYCDEHNNISTFSPNCDDSNDVGDCISSNSPPAINKAVICLNKDVNSCEVTCPQPVDVKYACTARKSDGSAIKAFDVYKYTSIGLCQPVSAGGPMNQEAFCPHNIKGIYYKVDETSPTLPVTTDYCKTCCG